MLQRSLATSLAVLVLVPVLHAAELPAAVAAKVRTIAPGATVDKVKVKERGGVQVFRVRVSFPDGRGGMIALAADGTLVRIDMEIDRGALPEAVAVAAAKLYPGAEFFQAALKGNRLGLFEVEYRQDGRDLDAIFDGQGNLVDRRDDLDPRALPVALLEKIAGDHPGARVIRARRRLQDGRDFFQVKIETHFRLTLPHPHGTKTNIRRVKVRELPLATQEALRAAVGGDVGRLRIIENVTAPVTTYAVEVKRKKDLEFDANVVLRKQAETRDGPARGPNSHRGKTARPAPSGDGQANPRGDVF